MATPQPDDDGFTTAYQQQVQAMRDQLATFVVGAWIALGAWRKGNIRPFLLDVLPTVLAAQRQISDLTTGYLTAHRSAVLGRSVALRVDPAKVSGAAARRGVQPAEVYERPFHLVWRQLADLPRVEGAIEQAIEAGQKRVEQTALTDLQLSKVQTFHRALGQDRAVTGYQRVLEGPHSCALCIIASTQRYHRVQLEPIHPGCDCSVQPLYGEDDGAPITAMVNVDGEMVPIGELADVHQRVEERFGVSSSAARAIPRRGLPDYKDVLITHEHGELGPILAVLGAPFLGPNDI